MCIVIKLFNFGCKAFADWLTFLNLSEHKQNVV